MGGAAWPTAPRAAAWTARAAGGTNPARRSEFAGSHIPAVRPGIRCPVDGGRTPSALAAVHLWAGSTFCDAILRAGLGKAGAVYTFNSAGLGLLTRARELGLTTVVEQTIVPAPVEDQLLAEEHEAFPDWQPSLARNRNRVAFRAREFGEWECADLIVCGSAFVRDGIRRRGGPISRTVVVPYGVDAAAPPVLRSLPRRPLRVLTVGAASLRKGTPYLLESARALQGAAVFRLVGNISVCPPPYAVWRIASS